ncbi:DUF4041 domain-containing protein [Iningainema tapete]|uniref:DUF4041 domain-containing protein n=1 Tax=Iningainema tapete BLCC-T55 TaxID=2748662 RepID=A0A8J6XQV9_9CYAN|nr:DUF4041 domain-containing protein [Iningainema tapete]MBD2777596.1 DUF4041 domain-containing protein [Iningainema tapete BLCC-T55]
MTKSFLKLVLTTFNTECEDIILKVKHSNINSSEDKIKNSLKKLNRLSEVTDCEITQEYLNMKFQELRLKYELECKKQEERDREQALRQEKKERDASEKAIQEVEEAAEREKQHQQELEKVIQEIKLSEGEQRNETC